MCERGEDNLRLHAQPLHQGDDPRRRSPAFKLNLQCRLGLSDQGQGILKARDGFTQSSIQARYFRIGEPSNPAGCIGRSIDSRVVHEDRSSVAAETNIDLDPVHAQPDGTANSPNRILWFESAGPAMGRDKKWLIIGHRSRRRL